MSIYQISCPTVKENGRKFFEKIVKKCWALEIAQISTQTILGQFKVPLIPRRKNIGNRNEGKTIL